MDNPPVAQVQEAASAAGETQAPSKKSRQMSYV